MRWLKQNWLKKELTVKSDILVVFINGLIVMGGVFVLNGIISRMYGLSVLGEFLLLKRTVVAGAAIVLVGANLGLPNYLSRQFQRSYGDAAMLLFITISIPLIVFAIIILKSIFIEGFIDSSNFWTYLIYACGISLQFLTYALFRGYMNIIGASLFQLVGTAIIPIFCFILFDQVGEAILYIGSVSIPVMLFGYFWRNVGIKISRNNIKEYKKLLFYGFQRIPSILSQFILLAGVPILVATISNLENVAYFNSSLSLLRLSLLVINPVGMVLLPTVARSLAKGETKRLNYGISGLIHIGLFVSFLSCLWLFIYAPAILKLWLGIVDESGIFILRFTVLAFPFYTIAGIARSPIDAASEKGYNSLIYGSAVLVLIISFLASRILGVDPLIGAIGSFNLAYLVAGAGSFMVLKRFFSVKLWDYTFFRDLLVGLFLLVIGFLLGRQTGMSDIVSGIGVMVIVSILFFYHLKTSNSTWLYRLRSLK